MPSTRTYRSILLSLNIAPVAMPSLATACRIPAPQHAPVARIPIATARSIPRPVNSLSVARKYTPIVQRARLSTSTTVATLATAFAAMSISNTPANQPKPISPLPPVVVASTKLAYKRIKAYRQKATAIADRQAAKKRPTPLVRCREVRTFQRLSCPPCLALKGMSKTSFGNKRTTIPPNICHTMQIP